jgi:mRNA-degrading endonuclease YafQ of YafQ-DinJ toxin-antitoxin module
LSYTPLYTPEFQKQLKKYRSLKNIIQNKVESLLIEPYHSNRSEPLHHKLKGLRSARVTQNIRIIFAICEEAKEYVREEIIQTCKELGGKAIVFVTIDVHEKAYR